MSKIPQPPCLCKAKRRVLCKYCVERALLPVQERHREARERWETARRNCLPPTEESPSLAELQETSYRLRKRLEYLNKLTSSAALEVCAAAVANERRQPHHQQALEVQEVHRRFQAFQQASYQAFEEAHDSAQQQVTALRRQWALAAFRIHKIVVDPVKTDHSAIKQARGIGKIGGLPLPNAGPELFAVLPASELQSALRMVASSTCLVARCLGINLPHPILLRPTLQHDDIVQCGGPSEEKVKSNRNSSNLPTSVAMAAQKVTRSVFSAPTGRLLAGASESSMVPPPSMDPSKVQQRLRHSRAAILAESDTPKSTTYALEASLLGEEFATAWQLLQNNVVHLCIRAGVPVSDLWPAQAVLLNLHALYLYCKQEDSVEHTEEMKTV